MGVAAQMLFGDIEAEVCRHLDTYLAAYAAGVGVTSRVLVTKQIAAQTSVGGLELPADWAVSVRDDGGTVESPVTRRHTIATTIIGPTTDTEGVLTAALAELVVLAVADMPMTESAVAAVTNQLGPMRIVHGNGVRPARYATHDLVITGRDPREVLGGRGR